MKKNYRVNRLPEETKQQLVESVEALILDSEAYDNGMFNMIKRSSATLRMLFYDSRTSHSLINQIESKKSLKMYSFIDYPIKQEIFYGSIYCARFFAQPPKVGYYDTFLFNPLKKDISNFLLMIGGMGQFLELGKIVTFQEVKSLSL